MNKFIEKIYFASPLLVQHAAVSAYGLLLNGQRYGGKNEQYLNQLRKSQFFSEAEITDLQTIELQKLISHLFATVPYYRRLAATSALSAADFKSLEDLRKLPVIDKEALRGNPKDFRSDAFSKVFALNTSGTSGKPLTIYCDKDSRRRHYAFWRRLREWFGINPEMRRATFFGRIIIPGDCNRPPFWRYDAFQRNYLFSSYHMSDANLGSYYDALREIQPDELIGYPSSLFSLAKYMHKNGLEGITPRAIITTAETLLEHQRELIEEVFQRRVVDQYGCTEMALFVSQCEQGTYHIHPEHGIVEIVDEHGNPVPFGEEGEAVCTGFVNYAMPMVRYRLGDRLVLGPGKCPCGRNFPVIKQIIGRTDDILVTPDGRPLGRLDPVFKGLSGIYETQIIQTKRNALVLRVVADPSFSSRNEADLLYEVGKRTGDSMSIRIERVADIPKDKNGKFRAVISRTEEIRETSRTIQ